MRTESNAGRANSHDRRHCARREAADLGIGQSILPPMRLDRLACHDRAYIGICTHERARNYLIGLRLLCA